MARSLLSYRDMDTKTTKLTCDTHKSILSIDRSLHDVTSYVEIVAVIDRQQYPQLLCLKMSKDYNSPRFVGVQASAFSLY